MGELHKLFMDAHEKAKALAMVAEAARNFVKVTAGLENTIEGAALLEAVRQMEKAND